MFNQLRNQSRKNLSYLLLFSVITGLVACGSDNGGNIGMRNNDGDVVTETHKLISSILPSTILSAGKESKISGFHLENATVTINGSVITPTLQTPHEIRFIAPVMPAGDYAMVIQNDTDTDETNVSYKSALLVKQMAAGFHSCAVLPNATVQCWGYNYNGELGNNTAVDSKLPVTVTGINNALAVSVGRTHSCAVLASGEVKCWGSNLAGQLGNNSLVSSKVPVTVKGIATAVAVSAGYGDYNCALLAGGSVQCWGANDAGQLGNNSNTKSKIPVTVTGINAAIAVSAGDSNSCALLSNGIVQCWGHNFSGQLGNNTTNDSAVPVIVHGISTAIAVSIAGDHSCALLSDGGVQCWGDNYYGELGDNSTNDSPVPVSVMGINTAIGLSVSSGYGCVVLSVGTVQCWGKNSSGQLGNNTNIDSTIPVMVNGVSSALAVSAGSDNTCVMLSDNTVQCWGENYSGIVGNGSSALSNVPVTVSDISTVVAVSVGGWGDRTRICAVLSNGAIQCWGKNAYRQSPQSASNIPVTVSNINTAITVSVNGDTSNNHVCAVLLDGGVQCWGSNDYGELGNNSSQYTDLPVMVSGISTAVSVSAGAMHTCALLSDGGVQCWGNNYYGQSGNNNSFYERYLPTSVSGLGTAVAVSAGEFSTCAVLLNGIVKCWGSNNSGQLGNGSLAEKSSVPVTVSGISTAVAISVGGGWYYGDYACAVLSSGSVKCWGNNSSGQLGNNSKRNSSIPVTVKGISTAVAVSVGDESACAQLSDGTMRCWGKVGGELGGDAILDSLVPVDFFHQQAKIVGIGMGGETACTLLDDGYLQCWGSLNEPLLNPLMPSLPVYQP